MSKLSVMPVNVEYIITGSLLARLFSIFPAALLVTLCLLYAMHLLVRNDYVLQSAKPTPPIPAINMDMPTEIITIIEKPPVRPVEQLPPPVIDTKVPVIVELGSATNFGGTPVIAKPPITGNFDFSGQMVPIIRIAPQYPQAAIARGIEGYVDIIFDVTALGTTDNIRIIAAVPSNVFNRSVIKAVSGWKYKPNIVNGAAVRTPDVKDRVRFNMEK